MTYTNDPTDLRKIVVWGYRFWGKWQLPCSFNVIYRYIYYDKILFQSCLPFIEDMDTRNIGVSMMINLEHYIISNPYPTLRLIQDHLCLVMSLIVMLFLKEA